MLPGMLTRLGTRDTWLTRNGPGGFFRRGRSGHVACSKGFRTWSHGLGTRGHVVRSEGFRRVALSVGFGDTWHSPKVSPKKVLKGFRKGLSVGASGHAACSEGFRRGSRAGGPGRWIRDRRLGGTCRFGPAELSGDAGHWIWLGRMRSAGEGVFFFNGRA